MICFFGISLHQVCPLYSYEASWCLDPEKSRFYWFLVLLSVCQALSCLAWNVSCLLVSFRIRKRHTFEAINIFSSKGQKFRSFYLIKKKTKRFNFELVRANAEWVKHYLAWTADLLEILHIYHPDSEPLKRVGRRRKKDALFFAQKGVGRREAAPSLAPMAGKKNLKSFVPHIFPQ